MLVRCAIETVVLASSCCGQDGQLDAQNARPAREERWRSPEMGKSLINDRASGEFVDMEFPRIPATHLSSVVNLLE